MQQVSVNSFEGNQFHIQVDFQDRCPICHTSVHPRLVAAISATYDSANVEVVFQCTKRECRHAFVGRYAKSAAPLSPALYLLESVVPVVAEKSVFSETITGLSPTFVEVHNQAMAAEAAGLDQLTGIGLRKALEFLVKDFAIAQKPAEKAEIEKINLGPCITKYIDDRNVKATASRATWLGNDETHYVRKWEDKEIKDLKLLIRLTTNWIENVLLTAKYENEMRDKKPPS